MGSNCFSKSSVDTKPTMDKIARGNLLLPLATQFHKELFGPSGAFTTGESPWVYEGQRVAGESPLQQQSYAMSSQMPYDAMAIRNAGLNMLSQSPNFDATRAYTSSLWQNDIMPSIMAQQAAMDSAGSGGTTRALSDAGQQLSLGLASQLAPMELQARQGAASMMPAYASMGMDQVSFLNQMGAQQRGVSQEQLTAEASKFWEANPWNHPGMNEAMGMMGSSQQIYNKPAGMGYSALMGPMDMFGQAIGGAISNVSDIRVKENIEEIKDALPLVSKLFARKYRYKGQPEERVGLVAQEVEKVVPEAVFEVDGLKVVDVYAIASLAVQAVAEIAAAKEIRE